MVQKFRSVPVEGPTEEELAAIEAEWRLIAAEVALVDAEIRALIAESQPTELDWRRVRRAQARVAREALAWSRHDTACRLDAGAVAAARIA